MDTDWKLFEAIVTARHCKRAYTDRPVDRELLAEVLSAAAHAPSTRNAQPWRLSVVSGPARDALAGCLVDEFDRGVAPTPDYPNRPRTPDPLADRRGRAATDGALRALGLADQGRAGRRSHLRMNLEFYGAPVVMVFHLPADAVPGAFLETGFFIQNVMLGLVARGLGSCPQFSVAGYPDVLREQLGLGDRLIVCALSVGYPDRDAAINAYAPARATPAEFTRWHDQTPRPSRQGSG